MAEGRGGGRDQTLLSFELCTRDKVSTRAEHVPVMNHTTVHTFATTSPRRIIVSYLLLVPAQQQISVFAR